MILFSDITSYSCHQFPFSSATLFLHVFLFRRVRTRNHLVKFSFSGSTLIRLSVLFWRGLLSHKEHLMFFFYWLISCQHVIRRKRCPDLKINGTVYTLHVYLNNWTMQYSFHRCKRNLLTILSPKVELVDIFLFLTELSVVLVCLCCLRLL